ncbi:hypothetical protein [Thermoflavimicrobium dichotomicum]|uniref:Uncharacterized protein n=1 Tax=Thermoflavimicrobium dichotomicum TaxID=46223 RepID=A0A1I3MNR7_9BACL|nr:hypothetical protein [Thermoflavimicrobium dichotomicum]SFI98581.1 hypothetical protein SAMN05421852_103140 [Thermoflavimicrobium dichotomicum]
MSVWKYERDVENLKIEIARLERMICEKQDEFQRATRRGEEADARLLRREQLKYEEKLREIIRELIHTERKLEKVKKEEKDPLGDLSWW